MRTHSPPSRPVGSWARSHTPNQSARRSHFTLLKEELMQTTQGATKKYRTLRIALLQDHMAS
jgi:hypothetical protein